MTEQERADAEAEERRNRLHGFVVTNEFAKSQTNLPSAQINHSNSRDDLFGPAGPNGLDQTKEVQDFDNGDVRGSYSNNGSVRAGRRAQKALSDLGRQ